MKKKIACVYTFIFVFFEVIGILNLMNPDFMTVFGLTVSSLIMSLIFGSIVMILYLLISSLSKSKVEK